MPKNTQKLTAQNLITFQNYLNRHSKRYLCNLGEYELKTFAGEEPELDDEDGVRKSALDMDPEAQAVMEMMGKTFVSKDVRAADEQDAKNKKETEEH